MKKHNMKQILKKIVPDEMSPVIGGGQGAEQDITMGTNVFI